MDHHQRHTFRFVAAMAAAVLLALIERPSPVHAQSVNNSYPSAAVSPISEAGMGADAESPDETATETAPPDVKADDVDESPAYPPPADSDTEAAPVRRPTAAPDQSGSVSRNDSVLEIPQVITPANAGPTDGSGNEEAAGESNEAAAAQSSAGGQMPADDDDLAAAAGEVGTLQDYENQAGAAPVGPVFFPPGARIVQFSRLSALNALSRPVGIPMATSPIILPPTSSGPFPSTSPMLMAPRTSPMLMAPRIGTLGAFPRGGLMGFRR